MKLTYLIILVFSSFNAHPQLNGLSFTDIDFKETLADSLNVKVDSILILGMGSSVTRIFISDLSDKVIKEMNGQNITASYFYLGKTTKEAKKEFQLMNKNGYNAILLFLPKDTALFESKYAESRITTPSRSGSITGTIATSRIFYHQIFEFQLYKVDTAMERIWAASVDIDCDPGKKNAANKVATKLLAKFKQNKYIK